MEVKKCKPFVVKPNHQLRVRLNPSLRAPPASEARRLSLKPEAYL